MKENLEDFINNNRDAFDSYEPGKKLWQSIEEQLPDVKKKQATVFRMTPLKWSVAAAAVLLLTVSLFYLPSFSHKKNNEDAVAIETSVPAEYTEEVYHFTKLIELKHRQLKKIEKEQPELYHQFSGDISKLDSNYQVLRKELPGHPNQEVLIQAMIENLKWQIDLLNEQINIIQKIKKSKTTTNEKISKSA